METWTIVALALLLDHLVGEPRRWHPLVGFGNVAKKVETLLYADRRAHGVIALSLLAVPAMAVAWALARPGIVGSVIAAIVLYAAIGLRSLREHALPVADALDAGDLDSARRWVGRMVSRDTAGLDRDQVATAATESVLENGNDAVFGALFWFALAGAPGVVLYRVVNTLDAMWGYRNARYGNYGWAAARLDDALNWIPARLTAFTYALFGNFNNALHCWRSQAPAWDSPNAGPVMAAGAGALDVRLGGAAPYEGQWCERPTLGNGDAPLPEDIRRALRLVSIGVIVWTVALFLLGRVIHA